MAWKVALNALTRMLAEELVAGYVRGFASCRSG
jgi:hypothetical protein